jgi:hypothetical protein
LGKPQDRHSSSPATSLVFETLEPRLLLAADPLGITAGYAFNESSGTTTADASGHGLTGTLTSGAVFTTAGKNGNALSLDGVNDYVNLANPTALRLTGSITISAWIYATSNPIDRCRYRIQAHGSWGWLPARHHDRYGPAYDWLQAHQ